MEGREGGGGRGRTRWGVKPIGSGEAGRSRETERDRERPREIERDRGIERGPRAAAPGRAGRGAAAEMLQKKGVEGRLWPSGGGGGGGGAAGQRLWAAGGVESRCRGARLSDRGPAGAARGVRGAWASDDLTKRSEPARICDHLKSVSRFTFGCEAGGRAGVDGGARRARECRAGPQEGGDRSDSESWSDGPGTERYGPDSPPEGSMGDRPAAQRACQEGSESVRDTVSVRDSGIRVRPSR